MKKLTNSFLRDMRIGAISLAAITAPFSILEISADTPAVAMEAAQQGKIKVTGTVVDEHGDPIIGANVLIKGITGVGTITDIDGQFNIDVPYENATLNVSFIGYTPVAVSYTHLTLPTN